MHADPDALAARITALAEGRPRVVVGIAGAPGAGKSTLAAAVAEAVAIRGLPVVGVPMDGFHLADVALTALGRLEAKGAIDTFDGAGFVAMLERIRRAEETVWAPAFDRGLEQPIAGSIPVPPSARVVITEGNYLLVPHDPWSRIPQVLDETWFLEVGDDLRRSRLVERHVRFGKPRDVAEAWVETVDEPNAVLIAATASRSDLLLQGE